MYNVCVFDVCEIMSFNLLVMYVYSEEIYSIFPIKIIIQGNKI